MRDINQVSIDQLIDQKDVEMREIIAMSASN